MFSHSLHVRQPFVCRRNKETYSPLHYCLKFHVVFTPFPFHLIIDDTRVGGPFIFDRVKRGDISPLPPPRFNVFFVRFLLSVWINSVSLVSFLFFFFFRFKISNGFKLLIILQLFIIIRDIDVINKYEIFLLKRLIFHRQKQNCIYLYYYFPRSNFNHTTYVQ